MNLSFLVSALLVNLLFPSPIFGVRVSMNLTLRYDDPQITFSRDWEFVPSSFHGRGVAATNTVGGSLRVEGIVNATAIYFFGYLGATSSTFVACVDCTPALGNNESQLAVVDVRDRATAVSEPVALFSITDLDPDVPHALRVVNLWDSPFTLSQITFDSLVVTRTQDAVWSCGSNVGTNSRTEASYSTPVVSSTGSSGILRLLTHPSKAGTNTFHSSLPAPTSDRSLSPPTNTPRPPITPPSPRGSSPVVTVTSPTSHSVPSPAPSPSSPTTSRFSADISAQPTSSPGDSDGSSGLLTPSNSFSAAVIALCVLFLTMLIACLLFGVATFFLWARARSSPTLGRYNIERDAAATTPHPTSPMIQERMARNSYTTYYGGTVIPRAALFKSVILTDPEVSTTHPSSLHRAEY